MSKSIKRVEQAAKAAGMDISVLRMPDSTRTAGEAAQACGCCVGQIVKSMIFEGDDGALVLLLISGAHQVALGQAERLLGQGLRRADPRRVRAEIGFAIGGVAPIGHLCEVTSWMDPALLRYEKIWAAAGGSNAVFAVAPQALQAATGAQLLPEGMIGSGDG